MALPPKVGHWVLASWHWAGESWGIATGGADVGLLGTVADSVRSGKKRHCSRQKSSTLVMWLTVLILSPVLW